MLDLREEKRARRNAWLGLAVGLAIAVGIGLVVGQGYLASRPETEPPPVRDLRAVDAGLGEGCALVAASRVTAEVETRARPAPDAMVRGTLPNETRLEVISVRRDYVEARVAGDVVWIDRRDVREECP